MILIIPRVSNMSIEMLVQHKYQSAQYSAIFVEYVSFYYNNSYVVSASETL